MSRVDHNEILELFDQELQRILSKPELACHIYQTYGLDRGGRWFKLVYEETFDILKQQTGAVLADARQQSENVSILGHADGAPFGHADGGPYGHTDGVPYGHTDGVPYGHADGVPYGHTDGVPYGHADGSPFGHTDIALNFGKMPVWRNQQQIESTLSGADVVERALQMVLQHDIVVP